MEANEKRYFVEQKYGMFGENICTGLIETKAFSTRYDSKVHKRNISAISKGLIPSGGCGVSNLPSRAIKLKFEKQGPNKSIR
jgi:hypothetical protein